MNAQRRVAEMRERLKGLFPHPDPMDSWTYLLTEVAEVGDILLRMKNPDDKRTHTTEEVPLDEQLAKELGDVMMMLCTLANHYKVSLELECIACCLDKEYKYGKG